MKNYLQIAKILLNIEKKALKTAKKQKIDVSDKKAHDLVTNYDTFMERFIISELGKKFGDIKIVSEEFNSTVEPKGTYFIIDPIDGTINFASGGADWGVQIAYVENDDIVAGAIHLPNSSDFYAAKGFGAYKNGERFYVKQRDMKHCLLTVDCQLEENFSIYREFAPEVMNFRRSGAACIDNTYLAEGVYGIYIYNRCHSWDYMPGQIILLEAGCVIKDYKNLHIAANNEKVLKKTIALLKKAL